MSSNWITSTETPEDCRSNPLFLCVLSNTDTCRIPNISAAGATTELNDYTPAGDAEIVVYGSTRSVPELPAIDLGAEPGRDIRYGGAVPRANAIYEGATQIGMQLGKLSDFTIIGESIPGGTTTALGILTALGYDYGVSSSYMENPLDIKRAVVRQGIDASGLTTDEARADPLRAIAAIGDPMMPAVAGLIRGMASSDTSIVLAGGTQMIAVFMILVHLGIDTRGISIATTKYVSQDPSIDFDAVIRDLGCPIHVADPGFAGSRMAGLRKYEAGMYAAGMLGVTQSEMLGAVEAVYAELMGGSSE
jgi:uncharacterized protein (TIGR00303 family)